MKRKRDFNKEISRPAVAMTLCLIFVPGLILTPFSSSSSACVFGVDGRYETIVAFFVGHQLCGDKNLPKQREREREGRLHGLKKGGINGNSDL
jgi:hypothetical protein